MWNKISSVLIGLFWLAVLGYLIYKEMYVVIIISMILLGMTMAFATSNEN